MTLRSGFFDSEAADRLYTAEDFSIYLEGIVANGCFPNDSGFLVTANPEILGEGEPPSVMISPGKAYYDGRWFTNDIEYKYEMGTGQQITPLLFHLLYFCFDTVDRIVTIDHICSSSPIIPANNDGKYYMPLARITDRLTLQPEPEDIDDNRLMAGVSAISVDTSDLVDGSVTTNKLANGSVTSGKLASDAALPAGVVMPYASLSIPEGWLLCNGMNISRISYARLFGAIGVLYGAGDGSTTFTIPDMRGRMPAGYDGTPSFSNLGVAGGAKDAAVVAHDHLGAPVAYNGWVFNNTGANVNPIYGGSNYHWDFLRNVHTASAGVTATNKNLPPYLTLNYIIKY